jgi:hypothetical protein
MPKGRKDHKVVMIHHEGREKHEVIYYIRANPS